MDFSTPQIIPRQNGWYCFLKRSFHHVGPKLRKLKPPTPNFFKWCAIALIFLWAHHSLDSSIYETMTARAGGWVDQALQHIKKGATRLWRMIGVWKVLVFEGWVDVESCHYRVWFEALWLSPVFLESEKKNDIFNSVLPIHCRVWDFGSESILQVRVGECEYRRLEPDIVQLRLQGMRWWALSIFHTLSWSNLKVGVTVRGPMTETVKKRAQRCAPCTSEDSKSWSDLIISTIEAKGTGVQVQVAPSPWLIPWRPNILFLLPF